MATSLINPDPQYLRAIVDMGSNGIRFSISSLQPPTARITPTIYQHRAGISLFDAQYSASTGDRQPIDEATISAVVAAFTDFKHTCSDFGVLADNIVVLATEATRTATNSEDFRRRIKEAVGWGVQMLAKEEEGRVGAMGVASSLPQVSGLVMDLGGGSTQLSWLGKTDEGGSGAELRMPASGAVSLPYGAAAMTRRLGEAEQNRSEAALRAEVKAAVREAFASLEVPDELRGQEGFTLYLSGGGFRGWGYILMSQHRVSPYPIPVINGFKALRHEFLDTAQVKTTAAAMLQDEDDGIFRVSDRRASQVPAVAFLVNALAEALPQIKEVRFCQGGVREGYLFSSLPPEVKNEHPLVVATQPFRPRSSEIIASLIQDAIPSMTGKVDSGDDYEGTFDFNLIQALTNLLFYHSSHSKDIQASSALRSTTSGILSGVHGILHESRTLLALLLCHRWGSDVPPTDQDFKKRLEQLIESPWTLWWINYLGAIAALIAIVYPVGVIEPTKPRMKLHAQWEETSKSNPQIILRVNFAPDVHHQIFEKELRNIEKVGKKKRWIGGKDGTGHKIVVQTENS